MSEDEEKCDMEEDCHQCDYVIDGYQDICCVCSEFEVQQRCADQISNMIDTAYDNYKDQQLRGMK